jgi:hypothetical protein
MTEQKNVNLYEAYASIYAPQEEVGQLDEAREASHDPEGYEEKETKSQSSRQRRMNDPHTGINSPAFQAFIAQRMGGGKKKKKPANEEVETDLFDTILEHLVSEGYADTNEAALAIMANMSEEWRESIVEEVLDEGEKPFPHEKVERKQKSLRDKGGNALERRMRMGAARRRADEAERTGGSQQDAGKGWYHGR